MANPKKTASAVRRLMRRLRGDQSGSVLAEYVLVTCMVVLPLVGLGNQVFSPSGGAMFNIDGTVAGGDFGAFGNTVVDFYRKIMCGVSLPTP
jgi:Flp pilus assembly pilin Flp